MLCIKRNSVLNAQKMEIIQKFNDNRFFFEDQVNLQTSIMARAHLGMKTFEDQIIRI